MRTVRCGGRGGVSASMHAGIHGGLFFPMHAECWDTQGQRWLPQCMLGYIPPCEQNDWQTGVKKLPFRNFVADGNNRNYRFFFSFSVLLTNERIVKSQFHSLFIYANFLREAWTMAVRKSPVFPTETQPRNSTSEAYRIHAPQNPKPISGPGSITRNVCTSLVQSPDIAQPHFSGTACREPPVTLS